MATYSKVLLSGATQGRQIKITQTATAGTTLHATGLSATIIDELTLFANNSSASDVVLTVEFGGTTSPDDLLIQTIPARAGDVIICTGKPLTGSGAAGLTTRAFAATANVINMSGFVNRYTP